jgi:hypothetical protein
VVISYRQKNSIGKIIKCHSDYKKHYIVWVQEHFLRQLFIYLFITIYIGSDLWEKYKDKIHLYIKYPPRAKEKKGDNYNSLPSLFFPLSLFRKPLIYIKSRSRWCLNYNNLITKGKVRNQSPIRRHSKTLTISYYIT